MTRPDLRLLAPVGCLPFVPDGARVWQGHRRRGWVRGVVADVRLDGDLFVVWADGRASWKAPAALYLDLSAPALRDGVPERLDALPWALEVLLSLFPERDPTMTTDAFWWSGVGVWGFADDGIGSLEGWRVDVDTAGLSLPEASRAVVAAALRQRGAR